MSNRQPERFFNIYSMDLDGGDLRRLTNVVDGAYGAKWSPQGDVIAFATTTRPGDFDSVEIHLMNPDGGNVRPITQGALPGTLSWSPDGRRIVFSSLRDDPDDTSVCLVDRDGRNMRRLVTGLRPAWSPDGQEIAFAQIHQNRVCIDIFIVNVASGATKQLTQNAPGRRSVWNDAPAWSPDGQWIVFRSDRNKPQNPLQDWDLYIMDRNGGNVRRLTDSVDRDDSPVWSPDGQQIAFSRSIGFLRDQSHIYVIGTDGRSLRNLTPHDSINTTPSWFDPSALTVSPRDKRLSAWGALKRSGSK